MAVLLVAALSLHSPVDPSASPDMRGSLAPWMHSPNVHRDARAVEQPAIREASSERHLFAIKSEQFSAAGSSSGAAQTAMLGAIPGGSLAAHRRACASQFRVGLQGQHVRLQI